MADFPNGERRMMVVMKLNYHQLRAECQEDWFKFETTSEVPPLEGIIGQDRAVQSLAFGLRMKEEGYNIYIMGLTGTGRNSYTRSIVSELARQQATPQDWCYVHDFERPDRPDAISFAPGKGGAFKAQIEDLIEQLREEIPKAFDSDEFKSLRTEAVQQFQRDSVVVMERVSNLARDNDLLFRPTGKGFVTVPMKDGRPLNEQQLQELDTENLKLINEQITRFQKDAEVQFEQLRSLEQELRDKLHSLEKAAGASIVDPLIEAIKGHHSGNDEALNYLHNLKEDILRNLKNFLPEETQEEGSVLSLTRTQGREGWDTKYRVNLFVDNSDTKGAPVIMESNANYHNLMGMIEFQPRMGTLTTDLTKIKSGAIHRANGGYLILQAEDLFSNPHSWRALKRALKDKEARVENVPDGTSGVLLGLKPQGMPLNVKVIIVGSYQIYSMLYQYEEDFKKLFKIRVDFDTEMDRAPEYISKMASFISRHCRDKGYKSFHRSAVAAIFDYSSRLAENQSKLSTRFNDIVELLAEANTWADLEGADTVRREHITKTLEQKRYRADKYEQRINELFEEGTYLLSTEGATVGQVNGLAVYNLGDYAFGKPSRITVNTFAGTKGVVNIEKEAQMSGKLHNKGVHILSGYLGMKFAQQFPLTLTATLCFEQSYDGVDGDSASSTELYGLLSSLADIPVKQELAVTGSVNQKGEIQPIGGVNQKIEGFYRVCKKKGLTGMQGVLIPQQNIKNLMLDNEVVEAVRQGQFHVYAVKTIDEGIELLTGVKAGEVDEQGQYPAGTIYHLVANKLQHYYRQSIKECLEK
jgi:lon-related putative ATP-dependent protease